MYVATMYWRSEDRGVCLIPITDDFYNVFKKDYSILKRDDVISVKVVANDVQLFATGEDIFKDDSLWEKIGYEIDYVIVSDSDIHKENEDWSSSPGMEILNVKGNSVEFFISDPWELGTVETNCISVDLKELREKIETKKMGLL